MSPRNRSGRAPAESEREVPIDGTGRIVVIAEPSDLVRGRMRDDLERFGYTVFEAADGATALRLNKHFTAPADVVIADRDLPADDGRELEAELAAAGSTARVLFVSRAGTHAASSRGDSRGNSRRNSRGLKVPMEAERLARYVDAAIRGSQGKA